MGRVRGPSGNEHHVPRVTPTFSHHSSSKSFSSTTCSHKQGSDKGGSSSHSRVVGPRNCKRDCHSSNAVLFKNLYSAQEKRQKKTNNRSFFFKQNACDPKVQDGDVGKDCEEYNSRPVGDFSRSVRCLSTSSTSLGVSQIFRLRSRGPNICVSGSPFRSLDRSLGLHKSHEAYQASSSASGDKMFILPGRLDSPGLIKVSSSRARSTAHCSFGTSGVSDQLGKVGANPTTKVAIFGDYAGSSQDGAILAPGQSHQDHRTLSGRSESSVCFQKEVGENNRFLQFCSRISSVGKNVPYSSDAVDECQYIASPKRCLGPSVQQSERSLITLDGTGGSKDSSSNAYSLSFSELDDRCLPFRLERSPFTSQCEGYLASGVERSLHQLERTICHLSVSPTLSPRSSRSDSVHSVGQQNSPSMHCSSGFSGFSSSPGSDQEASPLLSRSQHHIGSPTSERSVECIGRQSIKTRPNLHRVVSGSRILPRTLQSSGLSGSRPVCHQGKRPTLWVHIPLSGLHVPGHGCSHSRLEQVGKHICLPSVPTSSRSCGKVEALRRLRICDSPILADQRLVSISDDQVIQPHSSSGGLLPVPTHFEGEDLPSRCRQVQASRLETVRSGLLRKQFSPPVVDIMLQKYATSSAKQFQVPWGLFYLYLQTNKVKICDIGVPTVLDFLTSQRRERSLQYKTLAAYRCGLKDPLFHALDLDIDVQESRDFMRGLFNEICPNKRPPIPRWSLPSLLKFLRSPTFEPLSSCAWARLCQKTLALLLLASGRRISEITYISSEFSKCGNSVTLHWLPFFRAKMSSSSFSPDHPSIEVMSNSVEVDNLLCPVRSWEMFCQRRSEGADLSFEHGVSFGVWTIRVSLKLFAP